MRLHYHSIDRVKDGQSPRHLIHWSGWWRWVQGRPDADDERQVANLGVEVSVCKPVPEFSARLSVGTKGSETPFDAHLTLFRSGVYLQTESGRQLAHRLSQHWFNRCTNRNHQYESREIKIAIHNGSLWWNLWVHSDHWERNEFRRWRQGSVDLNLLNRVWGKRRCWREDVDQAEFDIYLEDGSYPAKATLQLVTLGRPKLKHRRVSWAVDIDVPRGVPSHYDPSDGWKGDRTYGFSITLPDARAKSSQWAIDARNAATAWVLNRRARSGFREPQKQD